MATLQTGCTLLPLQKGGFLVAAGFAQPSAFPHRLEHSSVPQEPGSAFWALWPSQGLQVPQPGVEGAGACSFPFPWVALCGEQLVTPRAVLNLTGQHLESRFLTPGKLQRKLATSLQEAAGRQHPSRSWPRPLGACEGLLETDALAARQLVTGNLKTSQGQLLQQNPRCCHL